jgi:hypothetical protein
MPTRDLDFLSNGDGVGPLETDPDGDGRELSTIEYSAAVRGGGVAGGTSNPEFSTGDASGKPDEAALGLPRVPGVLRIDTGEKFGDVMSAGEVSEVMRLAGVVGVVGVMGCVAEVTVTVGISSGESMKMRICRAVVMRSLQTSATSGVR